MYPLKILVFCCLLALTLTTNGQDMSTYSNELFISNNGDSLRYRLLKPTNHDIHKKYPLIIFLHGAGERGWDNNAQLLHGGEMFLRDSIRDRYQAYVLFPQCPPGATWAPMHIKHDSATGKIIQADFPIEGAPTRPAAALLKLIDSLRNSGKIDNRRIYIGGLSLGGMGTFYMITTHPEIFAAAFPICGAGNSAAADRFAKKVPIWIFHGDADPVVPVEASRAYNTRLKELGANVKYTEYPGVGHNSWDNVFVEPGLMKWLFSNRK
ncbi:MAG TPA: prolyl oligopeptidase family serine peptidase [Chitinophaga sp.]|uniref:carboxylesterase family protein n=1 Tax=Chitinophaga sp. TaxID=1869181 RepID=UPI002B7F62FC|nr:prolyl oligopeptidase family serine peptidase [Chitinophaga sp.]HVI47084.1 prolyl oligopeptidase family serine peptidase [Chitinophaga sp.]